jgi:hypothetical protein
MDLYCVFQMILSHIFHKPSCEMQLELTYIARCCFRLRSINFVNVR